MSKLNPNAKPFDPKQKIHKPVHRTEEKTVPKVKLIFNQKWYNIYGFGDKFIDFYFLNTSINPY